MLVLTRRVGEQILIGEGIAVTVLRIDAASVRIGIDASKDLLILRKEVDTDIKTKGVKTLTPKQS